MRTIDKLPEYLRKFCTPQDMDKYTARDHASWRYIMRRGLPFFRKHAVHVYEDGLQKTGLPLDRIPSVDYMDQALQKIGWGAIPICGFIPTFAFLEFQARKILPIATDMRSVDHIGYTPAPDIVHEAAGHAPILPDLDYADYLAKYAQLCTKAIYSKEDLNLFEAIRALSDIKEKPGASPKEIEACEQGLRQAVQENTYVSEQTQVARMSWWTNEYGLAGDLKDPKIFGAGLLSSVEESKNIYSEHVKKIRLSIDCIQTSYDITRPQPQLFVAEDMQHLVDLCEEMAARLSYRIGGAKAVNRAIEARTLTTAVLSSGLEISGQLTEMELGPEQRIDFLRWQGPVQLCEAQQQLEGQGKQRHPEGFSAPIGLLEGQDKDPCLLTDDELVSMGIVQSKRCEIKFKSGFKVEGTLDRIVRSSGTERRILYMTFHDCTVSKGAKTYYQPAWGPFDMPLASHVPSVYGGPSDRQAFDVQELKEIDSTPARQDPYSSQELAVFKVYEKIRALRDQSKSAKDYDQWGATLLEKHPTEWLALLEVYEQNRDDKIKQRLTQDDLYPESTRRLIKEGLDLLH